MAIHFERERAHMVEYHLMARGIRDPRVVQAFREVPRELFVPEDCQAYAYADSALPIGEGQTISQPYIVALTVVSLEVQSDDRVLDVGTGSGYAAAILSRLARQVISLERICPLAERARLNLERLHCSNVQIICSDATRGWPLLAPYGAISVAASSPQIPPPLMDELEVGGRLVIPIDSGGQQTLTCVTRLGQTNYQQKMLVQVQFVPLIADN
ncbi:protein-L-isoaspartate(D-aspartate) O-methyltransferase [Pajaroellobacter abortibovis]|uniref:Protein-L-isoaspartate O-methyltransferase n=1 Tax=Pajaroellobacter abortibovis TaxID=1882918 RepID=A0A1L6MVP0_9BACT|nr:protein-L-isoaspartate(D-aspartate) O-methyltransferase [Pajaroellobacter abortibovis]APR99613.1 protein-L-isoaspartate O-methyltransferase [Pajaroellobacter abortibovis]